MTSSAANRCNPFGCAGAQRRDRRGIACPSVASDPLMVGQAGAATGLVRSLPVKSRFPIRTPFQRRMS